MLELTAENKLQVGVKGWVEVRLINREGKVVHEHTQDNLILDKGLNYILSSLRVENIHLYVAVGTGSSTPATTQTVLDAEVARTNATLSVGPDIQITALADGYYRISRTRAFDYNQANANLTEFGASETTSGVNTRELFRDANGNPIVITKTSNERLAITYHIEIRFSPAVSTQFGTINFRDNGGTIVGSRIVRHLFTRPSDSSSRSIDLSLLAYVYRASNGNLSITTEIDSGIRFLLPGTTINEAYTATDVLIGDTDMAVAINAYSNGSFYRDFYGEVGAGTSDRTIYGYALTRVMRIPFNILYGCSYKAIFVDSAGNPAPFTKNKDYRFRWNQRFSIARI